VPPTKYAQSSKFAKLSASERARRISKIKDPRKRAAAERFWDVPSDDGGLFGSIVKVAKAPSKIAANLVGDVPQLASSLYQSGAQAYGATAEDVSKGRGLPGAAAFALGYPVWAMEQVMPGKGGISRPKGPYSYKKLPKEEQRSATGRLAEEMVKGVPGQLKLLADPHEWYENPGIQVLNLASLALPAARVGSIAKLSRSIRAANPEMPLAMANKAAIAESFHPGFVRAQGLRGGLAPRLIKGRYGPEEGVRGRMPSRQPVIRGITRALDKQSERLDVTRPESRWSASSKAQRMSQRERAAAVRLEKAKRAHLEGKIIESLLGPGLGAKIRRITDMPGRTDRPRAAAMTAGLEAPKGMGVREAAETKVKYLHDVLEEDGQLRPMQDAVDALKKERDDALEADPEADVKGLDEQIFLQGGKLDVLMGRGVPELSSPNRTKVYNHMVATVGRKDADKSIQQWDLAAWGNDLDNPTALYDKVDVQRLGDPADFKPEGAALFQRMAEGQGGWHFPLQRQLESLRGQQMTGTQLLGTLRNAGVKGEELRNSLVENTLEDIGEGMVDPGQILDRVEGTGYFQRFDPNIEVHTDEDGGYLSDTRWGPEDGPLGPALNSREGAPGEYFEMVVDMPGMEPRYGATEGSGAGRRHWGIPNNVYHVRGQIFYEDGVKKLLIEEIQSDWASDFRRAKQHGTHERSPEQDKADRAALDEKMAAAVEERKAARAEMDEWRAHHEKEGTEPPADRQAAIQQRVWRSEDEVDYVEDLIDEHEKWKDKRLPMSPMHSERYMIQAVHQIMRHADSEGVDEIVIVNGNTQAMRNGIVNVDETPSQMIGTKYYGAPGDEKQWNYREFTNPDGSPMSNEEIDDLLTVSLTDDTTSFLRLYDRDIPGLFKKHYGLEGEVLDDAYQGRLSAQPGPNDPAGTGGYVQPDGNMRGTTIRLTDEAKRKAREDKALYQTDPDGEARGATEFLADGKRRVTMFMGSNATTWSHELIHVLTPDLTPEHRKSLEDFVGKPYDEWTRTEHEKVADAWDSYWRDGHAPPSLREVFADLIKRMKDIWRKAGHEAVQVNPHVARTFDEMLGKRYNNTVILKDHEVAQVHADIADLQKALDSGDVDQMDEAVNALAELATQAEEAGAHILTRGKTPEQTAAILEGLSVRKNAVAEDFRRRGLMDNDEEAKGYFPHMSMWESIGAPPADPVRMAATADVVGTPRVTAKSINRNRNRLIRMQTGEVLNDPAVVTYILRARLRLLETIRARSDLYKVGDPIERGKPTMKDMVYVRNPDVTPEKMHAATQAANRLSERDFRDLSARQLADEVDEINDVDGMQDEMFWDPNKDKSRPAWVEDEANVRVVPRRIARNRLGDVFSSAPRGNAMATVGVVNALFRIASIYVRPWRYIPVNFTQNAVMVAMTNPAAFTKLVKRDVARITKDDPQLRHMIREQVGTIQATALPEFNVRPQTGMQRVERQLTKQSGQMGEMLGRWADVPIREAAWLNHAGKYGFTTASDLRRLIEDPDLAEVRDIVAQRTKEDLIDFDTLTPYEKEVMTRWLALWPFIRGITKWPFMYGREYPARLAVASLASGAIKGEETNMTVQDMGIANFFGKDINIGKLDPSAPGREAVQNAVALMRGVGKVANGEQPDLTAFTGNYLSPGLREMIGMASGEGRKNWLQSVGRTFVPGLGIGLDVKKGGSIADQSLRQMGLVRERTDGVRKEVKEWMGPLDKVAKQMREKGLTPPPLLTQMQKLRAPYGDWKQYESETKFAKRDRGEGDTLTKAERISGLLDVAEQYYPKLFAQADASAKRAGWDSFKELADSGQMADEQLDKIDRYLYDQMFGAMEKMKSQAKEAGYDVE